MREIDLVITWVDGNDPEWRAQKAAVTGIDDGDSVRYRDWDLLRYLLRGVDAFLPWIRRVHLITWGHLPSWINTEAEKLQVVNHRDYIPDSCLPTFNSNAIELNMHRIDGLAEQFIYANDDMCFLRELSPEFFFKDGLPVDIGVEHPHQFFSGSIDHIIGNNLAVINKHFSKKETLRRCRKQWYSLKQGKGCLKNLYLSPFACFTGFFDPHLPLAYRKSVWEDVWDKEGDRLRETCSHTLRSTDDLSHWLFRYWQLVSGEFSPSGGTRGQFFSIGRDNADIAAAITRQSYPMICLNDDDPSLDFEAEKDTLHRLFEQILPQKSSFER